MIITFHFQGTNYKHRKIFEYQKQYTIFVLIINLTQLKNCFERRTFCSAGNFESENPLLNQKIDQVFCAFYYFAV